MTRESIGAVDVIQGDALQVLQCLPSCSVHCVVTSPPYYGLRDYGADGQIGLEPTLQEFITRLVAVFREVRRVLVDDGTCWVNMGDSYGGSLAGKQKDLMGVPWRLAFALQDDGWYLRQDIIWHKPNPMPESVRDRCTKAHEYVFLLSKSGRYYFDQAQIREPVTGNAHSRGRGINPKAAYKTPDGWDTSVGEGKHGSIHKQGREKGKPRSKQNESFSAAVRDTVEDRNKRSVWTVSTKPYAEAHFATYPPELIQPCILAGCPPGGTVLDPFGGSGTTGEVAAQLGRQAILIELNPDYVDLIRRRVTDAQRQAVLF